MSCYFNFDEDVLFTEVFKNNPCVRIVTGHGDRPDDDVHYKIIDGGLKAYISRHEVASPERRYRMIDCTKCQKAGGHTSQMCCWNPIRLML